MTSKEKYLYLKNSHDYKTAGLDVQYKIVMDETDKVIRLCFQESASKQDWIINFTFWKKPYKHQEATFYVHAGYVKAWKSCNDVVMQELQQAVKDNPGHTVEIIGWSYGGFMALMAAEDWNYRTGDKADVETFGAPKGLYFKKSRDHFRSCCAGIKQHARRNDIVTWNVPWPWVYNVLKVEYCEPFSIKRLFNPNVEHTTYEDVL